MKPFFPLSLCLFSSLTLFAQIPETSLSTLPPQQNLFSVCGTGFWYNLSKPFDLDGDQDLDLLTISTNGTFIWYENIDGFNTNTWPEKIITNLGGVPVDMTAADLDGDGDLDIICSFSEPDRTVWYENLDGTGNFGTARTIAEVSFRRFRQMDIDADGDLDFLELTQVDNGDFTQISWLENLDNSTDFVVHHWLTIAPNAGYDYKDLDNDGLEDLITSNPDDLSVGWHKHLDGMGNFAPRSVIGRSTSTVTWFAPAFDVRALALR